MEASVIVALIGLLGTMFSATISAIVLYQTNRIKAQGEATHILVNSKMTELLDVTKRSSSAEGYTAGEQAQRDRVESGEVVLRTNNNVTNSPTLEETTKDNTKQIVAAIRQLPGQAAEQGFPVHTTQDSEETHTDK
jgi:hypothetical protein